MGARGNEFVCELCGETKQRRTATTRFCYDCRRHRQSEITAIRNKEYAESQKAEEAKAASYIEPALVVEKPEFTLSEVNLMARRCNMSYGQYVTAWKQGRVPEPIKIEKPKKKRGRPCKGT
jgi:hypothetical protein